MPDIINATSRKYILLSLLSVVTLSLAIVYNKLKTHDPNVDSLSANEELIKVQGDSMSPFIRPGAQLRHWPGYYADHPVVCGDIVTFRVPNESRTLIKRVIAVPGDHLEMRDRSLYVNGELAKTLGGIEYEFRSESFTALVDLTRVVPDHAILVMSELRKGSMDSSKFGFIPVSALRGKVSLSQDPP